MFHSRFVIKLTMNPEDLLPAKTEVPLNSLDLDYWDKRWQDGKTGWHKTEANDMLVMYHGHYKEEGTVLFPMCGKTVDMKYLYEGGFSVVGVEYSKQPVEEFLSENDIKFVVSKNGAYDTYKSEDGKITIHCGDFFQAKPEIVGKIDGIWDRGALVAMNPCDRSKYAEIILSLMDKDTVYLIAGLSYDQNCHGGPPFSVPMETVEELYGSTCEIEILLEAPNESSMKRFKLDWWLDTLYKLNLKK